jgi:hypothetical protein
MLLSQLQEGAKNITARLLKPGAMPCLTAMAGNSI